MQNCGSSRTDIVVAALALGTLMITFGAAQPKAARQQAQEIVCQANLYAIGLAGVQYSQDNDDVLMPAHASSTSWSWEYDFWPARINIYLGLPERTSPASDAYVGTVVFCPANRGVPWHTQSYSGLSYVPNGFCGGAWTSSSGQWQLAGSFSSAVNKDLPVRMTQNSIRQPSSFLVLTDMRENYIRSYLDLFNPTPYVGIQHRGAANALLADGHSRRLNVASGPTLEFRNLLKELMDDR